MNFRRLNADLHRDIGCFLSGLILVYCLSGIALNHVNDWNPDFVIQRRSIPIEGSYTTADITADRVAEFSRLVGETTPKVHDFPTANHVKIYYDNASLLVDLVTKIGTYERVQRRPLFYQTNALHRNSLKGWKWASDLFAVLLILVTLSGWFLLRGRHVLGRGKWFLLAGFVPPIAAILIFQFLQK